MDIALLLIRLAVGGILAAHGTQKLFGWFGGHGLAGTAGFLESLGFRPGRPYAWLLGGTELTAGLALAAGFLTPLAAAGVAGVMLAAIAVVHWSKGFFTMDGGYEFPLALAVSAIAMGFSGAGRWSVDNAFDWTLGGEAWGIAAAMAAALAAAAVVSARGIRVHRSGRRPASAWPSSRGPHTTTPPPAQLSRAPKGPARGRPLALGDGAALAIVGIAVAAKAEFGQRQRCRASLALSGPR